MTTAATPTWILLLPVSAERVRGLADAYLLQEIDTDPEAWWQTHELRALAPDSSAIIANDSDDGDGALPLAEAIATRQQVSVTVLEFGDPPYTARFHAGQMEILAESPYGLASRLALTDLAAVPAAADPSPPPAPRSVSVVEGASPEAVREALQRSLALAALPWLHFEPIPGGTLIWSDTGDTQYAGGSVVEERADLVAYDLVYEPERDRFCVQVFGGREEGEFRVSAGRPEPGSGLASVAGETDPDRICGKLGVPAAFRPAAPRG